MNRIHVFILALCAASGCGKKNDAAPPPADPSSAAAAPDDSGCEKVKGLAKICYDNGGGNVQCGDLRDVAVEQAAKADLKPSLQQALGNLCEKACEARQGGTAWADIDASFSCGGAATASAGGPTALPGTYKQGLGQPLITVVNQLDTDVTIVLSGTTDGSFTVPTGGQLDIRVPAGTFAFTASMPNGEKLSGAHIVEQDNAYTWVFSRGQ